MSVIGFQKETLDGGWVGGVSSIQVFLNHWTFFNIAKLLNMSRCRLVYSSIFHYSWQFQLLGSGIIGGISLIRLTAGPIRDFTVCNKHCAELILGE